MKQIEEKHSKSRLKFIAFLNFETVHQRQNGHISLANNYASAGNSFSRFLHTKGKSEISFKKMTSDLVSDYEAWLQTCGLCRNTTSFYIRALQSVYHKAVRQSLTEDRRPFDEAYRGVARTAKRAINASDICRLNALDIRGALLSSGEYENGKRLDNMQRQLEFARDIFIFQCYIGCRISDLLSFTESNIVTSDNGISVQYVPSKTKEERPRVVKVYLAPTAIEILERYKGSNRSTIFPYFSTGKLNDLIHRIFFILYFHPKPPYEISLKTSLLNPKVFA